MDKFRLSPYQQNIMDSIEYSKRNLLIEAKAGSGKTSTLIMIADKIVSKGNKCLFLAFNKSIVDELRTRITDKNCEIKTIHSLGYSMVRNFLYRKYNGNSIPVTIDSNRSYNYTKLAFENVYKDIVDNLYEDEMQKKTIFYNLCGNTVSLINYLKYNLTDLTEDRDIQEIIKQYELEDELEPFIHLNKQVSYYDFVVSIIDKMDRDFIENTEHRYTIDFTDMIWLPYRFDMEVPFFLNDFLDYVLVDESQDLNKLEQHIVKKLGSNGKTRFIFVGDARQSIYQFAGADQKSMPNIKNTFNTEELPLNICYRCPENVIRLAQSVVPTIDWNRSREDKGNVEFIDKNNYISRLQPGDVIIGRWNSKLLQEFINITLKEHKQVKFKNQQLVTWIYKRVEWLLNDYVERYNKGFNIERKFAEVIKDDSLTSKIIQESGIDMESEHYNKSKLLREALILEESKITKEKTRKRKNFDLEYVKVCMKEYEEKCLPEIKDESDILDCSDKVQEFIGYYRGIKYFIDYYMEKYKDGNINDLLKYIKNFLNANENQNVPILSSIHMMKGGEADNIFIIDYPTLAHVCKFKDADVARNLYYVAVTRAKKNLYLVYDKFDINAGEAMVDVEMALKAKINIKQPTLREDIKTDSDSDIGARLNVKDVL